MRTARYVIALAALLILPGCAMASGTEGPRLAVSPGCVELGTEVSLTVHTQPRGPVLYATEYADGNSGAPEPMGEGYGGNDGGFADQDGVYRSSWTVAEDAPAGPVSLRVVLPRRDHDHAHDHDGEDEETPELHGTFEVGGPDGC